MYGNVVSLIALVPMLMHSIFGCCWHHAHTHAEQVHVLSGVSESDASLYHIHASHQGCSSRCLSASDEENYPCNSPAESPCEEDRCAYQGVVTTVVLQFWGLESCGFTQFIFADLHVTQQSQLVTLGELPDRLLSHSARERRALAQIWLI